MDDVVMISADEARRLSAEARDRTFKTAIGEALNRVDSRIRAAARSGWTCANMAHSEIAGDEEVTETTLRVAKETARDLRERGYSVENSFERGGSGSSWRMAISWAGACERRGMAHGAPALSADEARRLSAEARGRSFDSDVGKALNRVDSRIRAEARDGNRWLFLYYSDFVDGDVWSDANQRIAGEVVKDLRERGYSVERRNSGTCWSLTISWICACNCRCHGTSRCPRGFVVRGD